MNPENGGMYMPVQPVGNNGLGGNDFGGGWLLLLFFILLLGGNGWGNNGYGNGAGNLYPWMNQQAQMTEGFRDQMLNTQIEGIRNGQVTGFGDTALGIAGLGRQICETGGNITGAIRDGFYGAEIAANGRQMASMQQNFGIQTGIGDVKYTIANEGCQTRNQSMMNTRDIIDNDNRNHQAVMDKLCQLELDGYKNQLAQANRENVALQNQLNMAAFRESQTAQNAFISQGFANEVDQLYNRLSSCPVPTTPVYGRTPIFTCNNNSCGCPGNSFMN